MLCGAAWVEGLRGCAGALDAVVCVDSGTPSLHLDINMTASACVCVYACVVCCVTSPSRVCPPPHQEGERVMEMFTQHLHLPVTMVDHSKVMLERLAGVSDPEKKRKIIGAEFIEVRVGCALCVWCVTAVAAAGVCIAAGV